MPHPTADTPRRFTTRAQDEFRSGGRRRIAGAIAVALLGLALLVLLGPDESAVKERFEYYGAPGELRIMEEISIDEGQDRAEQIPKSLQVPPPPARLEIEEDEVSEDGIEPMPEEKEADPNRIDAAVKNPQENAEMSEEYQVEMSLPMQTSRYFHLLHAPRPDYPLRATESDRRTPVITVVVAIWLAEDGTVSDAIVQRNSGTQAFADAVLEAVLTWRVGWVDEPRPGLNLVIPFNFKSPYFTPGR